MKCKDYIQFKKELEKKFKFAILQQEFFEEISFKDIRFELTLYNIENKRILFTTRQNLKIFLKEYFNFEKITFLFRYGKGRRNRVFYIILYRKDYFLKGKN